MKKFVLLPITILALGLTCLGSIKQKYPILVDGEYAPEGMVAYAASYTDDPKSEPQYSTQNTKTFQYLNLGKTHDFYRGDSVKVGIIDSGINYDHEDFMVNSSSKVKGDSKYYAYDYDSSKWVYYKASQHGYSYIDDTLGHGTNVAATVAAAVNSIGGTGLAPNVELYVYKVTNSNNGYEFGAIQNALTDAKSLGIDVINMSFQSYEHAVSYSGSSMDASSGCSSILTSWLNTAHNAGITLVGAAGNYNTTEPSYPGSNNYVINVGSLNQTGTDKAGFSNYGSTIDLVAPGYVHVANKGTDSSYTDTSGTSFSAPLVTAAIALYIQQNPSATPSQIESALYASCDPIDDSSSPYTNWAGNGALNVAKFLGCDTQDGPTEIVINNPEIVNEELNLEIGDHLDLDWTVNGTGTFDDSVNFYTTSGNDNVVTISNTGRINAVGEGTDTIVIESNADSTIFVSIDVTVTSSGGSSPTVTLVDVTPSSLTLDLNGTKTATLTATVNGDNNPSQVVTWSSSNPSVATVSATGLVTGVATGNATITATSQEDASKSGTCSVTVTGSTAPTDSTQYSLITSVDQLEVGKSYLIAGGVSSNKIKTMSSASNGNNRPTVELSVSNNKVTRGSTALSVALGGSDGAYTFKTDNYGGTAGYLNATSTTGSNYLQVVSTLDKYAYFSISFSSEQAVITCTGKSSRNIIRLNTSGTPIACYSSGQNPVYLWKEVTTKTLSSISVSTPPTKKTYEAGENFDPTGLIINRIYSDTSSDTYTYAGHTSEFSFSPTTSTALKITDKSVTITYGGLSCSQSITVTEPKVPSSISVSGQKESFVEGDTFSFGGTVTAHYTDGTTGNVTSQATFSGYDMTTIGSQTVNVSFGGKSTAYSITVSQGMLSSISVSGQTTEFIKNHAFVFDGTCNATFANGYQKTVTPTNVSSPDMTTAGQKQVTVTFTYNGITVNTSYSITVASNRTVIEVTETTQEAVFGTITYPDNTETISNEALSIEKGSDYTIVENNSIRLGSGSNTGTITVKSTTSNIVKVVVSAKSYGSDSSVHLSIGGTDNTITSSYSNYTKEFTTATNSCVIATTANKKRAYVQSITVYEMKTIRTETDISNTEDCLGLETFIDTYMHMDYVENLGYCKDSEHHYYSTAKGAFNVLNAHQRSLFTSNSAYLTEWTRLSTWAEINGDSLNSSNILEQKTNIKSFMINQNSEEILLVTIFTAVNIIGVAYLVIKKRKHKNI